MAPQRGFIVSYQPYAMVLDIDLECQKEYTAQLINDSEIKHLFLRNGPIKLNPHQGYFEINGDTKTIEYIKNLKTYSIQGNYATTKDEIYAFTEPRFALKELGFEKVISENSVKFLIHESIIDKMSDANVIILCKDVESIDPSYDLSCFLFKNKSQDLFYKNGLDYILNILEEKFLNYKLSGNIYRTKNGLRIILTDKIRDLNNSELRSVYANFMEDMLMDNGLIYGYRKELDSPEANTNYLARLTPKLKNYSVFDSSYEEILDLVDAFKINESVILNKSIPYKIDLNNTYYTDNCEKNKFVEKGFEMLQGLIKKYIKSNDYCVCKLIKKIKHSEEVPEILDFIEYHDKWTKSYKIDSVLI